MQLDLTPSCPSCGLRIHISEPSKVAPFEGGQVNFKCSDCGQCFSADVELCYSNYDVLEIKGEFIETE